MLNTRMENGGTARQWTCTESGCAIELRWERPSPGAYSPAPICACVSTRQAIRRRDRTRQPVTTPQLVTPLESVKQTSCNGDFGYRRVSPHPGLPLFTMRTLLSGRRISCSVAAWSIMDSVFFLQTLLSRALQDDGWLDCVGCTTPTAFYRWCIRCTYMHWLARGASTPYIGCSGRRTYCCLMLGSRRGYDPDGPVVVVPLRESSQTSGSSRRFCFTKWEEAFS
ncbi:hypothetical protein EVAR_77971_1 [Eumeta japonica]|uniref:Uncharacterized protein n=1 Tax=Eumeta variegata TaxID=151549 RepID=A0A4C1SZZ2_EUMVA|nr:hypothetical protein EVAR_77971_1 [Eumeta japonica]